MAHQVINIILGAALPPATLPLALRPTAGQAPREESRASKRPKGLPVNAILFPRRPGHINIVLPLNNSPDLVLLYLLFVWDSYLIVS